MGDEFADWYFAFARTPGVWPSFLVCAVAALVLGFCVTFEILAPLWAIPVVILTWPCTFTSLLQLNVSMMLRIIQLFDYWLLLGYMTTFIVAMAILLRNNVGFVGISIGIYGMSILTLFADAGTPGGRVQAGRFAFTLSIIMTAWMLSLAVFNLVPYVDIELPLPGAYKYTVSQIAM